MSIAVLGWVFLVLIRPENFRDAAYPPPDWLCAPERKRLRTALAGLVGLCFILLLVPFLMTVVPAMLAMLDLTLSTGQQR